MANKIRSDAVTDGVAKAEGIGKVKLINILHNTNLHNNITKWALQGGLC